jgi:hypothetical protein
VKLKIVRKIELESSRVSHSCSFARLSRISVFSKTNLRRVRTHRHSDPTACFRFLNILKKKILLDAPHSFVTTIDAFSLLCSLCLSLSLINYKYQQVNHQRPNKKRTITTIMKLTSALLSSLLLATGTCGRQCTFILNCMTAIGFR